MATLQIKLHDPFLVIPHDQAQISSAVDPRISSTTPLRGTVIVSLTKPLKVSSFSITLRGNTHLANLGVAGKRTHYSRQHLQIQHFILAPHCDPGKYYTLVQQNRQPNSPSEPSSSSFAPLSAVTAAAPTTLLPSAHESPEPACPRHIQELGENGPLSFDFEIPVPNNVPVSVMTPQGGTMYRLTATLTVAHNKDRSRGSTASGLFSFLSRGPGAISESLTVQIYSTGLLRSCPRMRSANYGDLGRPNDENEEPVVEQDITPYSISKVWPGQLEAKATIAYTRLPAKSIPDIKVQVQSLGEKLLKINSFQAALWERAIYRVQRTAQIVTRTQDPSTVPVSSMAVIGIRDRAISTQSCSKPWLIETPAGPSRHAIMKKTGYFATPSSIRGPKELFSVRNSNPSTFRQISRCECCEPAHEDASIQDSEFGDIAIEIQHFLRCSVMVQGAAASGSCSSSPTSPSVPLTRPVEWHIGNIPVVLCGVPSSPEVDATGLPTYMSSFSSSVPSLEETRTYESTRVSFGSENFRDTTFNGREGCEVRDSRIGGRGGRASLRTSWGSMVYDDYDNADDVYTTVMGGHIDSGVFALPDYEESVDRLQI